MRQSSHCVTVDRGRKRHGSEKFERLKAGYAAWHERKGDALDVWREMMDERFSLLSMNEATPGLGFAVDRHSREDALAYLGGIFKEWEMVHYTPETFVADGDNIAMFGTCAYRNKRPARSRSAASPTSGNSGMARPSP